MKARVVDGRLLSASGEVARRIYIIDADTGRVPMVIGERPHGLHLRIVAAADGEDPGGGWPLDVARLTESPERWMTRFGTWGWRPAIVEWLDRAGLEWLQLVQPTERV